MHFHHRIGLGAGPVSGLMTGGDLSMQVKVLKSALDAGIDWIDTAAGYGAGKSETALGKALQALHHPKVQIATKFRLTPDQLENPTNYVRESVLASLNRLQQSSCELLYLHNAITPATGDAPDSIGIEQVLRPGGILDAMQALRSEGLVRNLAITATGDPECNLQALATGNVQAMQIPFHLLNPSAVIPTPSGMVEMDYHLQIPKAKALGVRVFAIRVLAGGALALRPPSAHTLTTPYFPLALFQSDHERASRLLPLLPVGLSLTEAAIRFVLGFLDVDCLLLGLATSEEITELAHMAELGPLPTPLQKQLLSAVLKNVEP